MASRLWAPLAPVGWGHPFLSRGCNLRARGFTEQMLGWGSSSATGPALPHAAPTPYKALHVWRGAVTHTWGALLSFL